MIIGVYGAVIGFATPLILLYQAKMDADAFGTTINVYALYGASCLFALTGWLLFSKVKNWTLAKALIVPILFGVIAYFVAGLIYMVIGFLTIL